MNELVLRTDVTVDLIDTNATDEGVARAAWVSTLGSDAKIQDDPGRIPGLINYLIKNRHGSPLEHNTFTFMIRCPIFVIREFHRHRVGWSYNEESGRYSKLQAEFYVPNVERNLIQVGKVGNYTFEPGSDEQYRTVFNSVVDSSSAAWNLYNTMLDSGIAKEVARIVLPLNIYSSFYATCNARSLMHFLGLRTENESATFKSHPQAEIQMVADKMEAHFKNTMPFTYASWNNNGRVSP